MTISPADALAPIVRGLDDAGIVYMVAGSFASTYHGVPRATHDIDIVIDPTAETLEAWLASLDDER